MCLAVFGGLRAALLLERGELQLDRWVAERLSNGNEDEPALEELVERIAAAPGSRKGAFVLIVAVAAWAWIRRRDLRWGLLATASFIAATSTVELVKRGVFDPLLGNLDRTYLSAHAANVTAVAGIVLVMVALARPTPWLIAGVAAAVTTLIAMVSLAMMVDERHFLTDIVGGIAVAGAWICVLTPVAYEMWRRPALVRALVRERDGEAGPHGAAAARPVVRANDDQDTVVAADAPATNTTLEPDTPPR